MEIGKAIYRILSSDTDVSGMVGTRIFPNRIPIDNAVPSIVYNVVTTEPSNTKNGVSKLDTISVDIAVFGKSYELANTLAGYVRTAMDYQYTDQSPVVGIDIQQITFNGQSDEFDENFGDHGIHYINLEFNIRQKI